MLQVFTLCFKLAILCSKISLVYCSARAKNLVRFFVQPRILLLVLIHEHELPVSFYFNPDVNL